jgi:hypothetical protein
MRWRPWSKGAPNRGPEGSWFLRIDEIGDEAARSVAETGYPGDSKAVRRGVNERAVAQVRAAEALPIDPEAACSDRWLLERFEWLERIRERALADLESARALEGGRRMKVASLPRPIGVLGWILIAVPVGALLAAGVVVLAGHLSPSVDAFILRRYVTSILQGESEAYSAELSFCLALFTAAFVLGAPFLLVLRTRGAVSWALKLLIIVGDLIIAAAYGLMRLADTFSFQALSVSLIELAVSLLATVCALGLGSLLRKDLPKVEPYAVAVAERRATLRLRRDAERGLEKADAVLQAHGETVAKREDAHRRRDLTRALALATSDAACTVAVAKLVAEAAKEPPEERVADEIAAHLAAEFNREEKRRANHERS